MDTNDIRPVGLLICALGGEGGGVLSEWLVETARHAGYPVQASSIPGVAQRTGATTYYIEVFPQPLAALGGRRPVFSLNPVPGAIDAMVSSELLETTRQIGNGMTDPARTLVISSSSRTLTTQERMQMTDGRVDSARLVAVVKRFSRAHRIMDMAALAREAGTVVSAVMLGAVAGSGLFPFLRREDYEAVVRAGGGASAEASLRGFAAGWKAAAEPAQADAAQPALRDAGLLQAGRADTAKAAIAPGRAVAAPATAAAAPAATPASPGQPSPDFEALGRARLLEYQDAAYARLYEQRLARVREAERAADPAGTHGGATTREMARWLALWMAFDDIVRVADLKSRASRWDRVRQEVKAREQDLLRVYDHFKPGVAEFAALLPPALAQHLLRWDRARVARGRESWALPLKVGTHSVGGLLMLRGLASLRWLRRHGSRWAAEQAMIERWLEAVVAGTRRDWRLGHEIAQCGRLIKGYGSTNERGKEALLHVVDHLAGLPDALAAADAVAAARAAAVADDAGRALDATLAGLGAPPRPVKEQPIRFVRKGKPVEAQA